MITAGVYNGGGGCLRLSQLVNNFNTTFAWC